MEILQKVVRKEITLLDMKYLAKETKKLATLREYFVSFTGVTDWTDAQHRYPNHATLQNLKRLIDYDVQCVPHQLKSFCERIVHSGAQSDNLNSHVFIHTFE